MDKQCILISASRYLNVVYNIDLFSEDESAVRKLRSYTKILNEDDVLSEYWEMYKSYDQGQEKVQELTAGSTPIADDFSLWDMNSEVDFSEVEFTAKETFPAEIEVATEKEIKKTPFAEVRITLPRGI